MREYAEAEDCEVFVVCAQIEQEIAELDDEEKKMFLEDLGLEESGLEKLIKASYHLLGLISYLTAGEPGGARMDDQAGNESAAGSRKRSIPILSVDLSVRRS